MTRITISKDGITRGSIRVGATVTAYPEQTADEADRRAIEHARVNVAAGVKPDKLKARMKERGYDVEVIKR